jgi:hypothetical protein
LLLRLISGALSDANALEFWATNEWNFYQASGFNGTRVFTKVFHLANLNPVTERTMIASSIRQMSHVG